MEQNKMTPTPWVAGGTYPYKGNEGYIFDTSRPEILVCKTFGSIDENSPSIGEQAENSKAIVTAVNNTYGYSIHPEGVVFLYEALTNMIKQFEGSIGSQEPKRAKAIESAKAALAKAKL